MARPKRSKKPRKKAGRPKPPGEIVGEMNGFPVRRIPVSSLAPADYNPRAITKLALGGLKSSVKEFGLTQPIVWNRRTNRVVGGHQRLKTLDPGSETDVVEVDLDETREKALNLALNNPHTSGDWTSGLADILDGLDGLDDLVARLSLDSLRVDVPNFIDPIAPDEFPEVGEDIHTDHKCPRCGYEFSGN